MLDPPRFSTRCFFATGLAGCILALQIKAGTCSGCFRSYVRDNIVVQKLKRQEQPFERDYPSVLSRAVDAPPSTGPYKHDYHFQVNLWT
jgi:hypothetical protein